MKKVAYLFAILLMAAIGFQSCVDEDGAGVPAPKSMFMEANEYNVDLTNDEVQTLTVRWIDVENATYTVTLTNQGNDVTEELTNAVTKGELNVLSMDIPYAQLQAYVEKAELEGLLGCDFFINITGKPIDANQKTALSPEGSTVQATVHYVE